MSRKREQERNEEFGYQENQLRREKKTSFNAEKRPANERQRKEQFNYERLFYEALKKMN